MKVFVVGANGMLGSQVVTQLRSSGFETAEITRQTVSNLPVKLKSPKHLLAELGVSESDVIVNCLGVTRHRMQTQSAEQLEMAWYLNAEFPQKLVNAADNLAAEVIQTGTDCVFSGNRGGYLESDDYDATDDYGLAKAQGEKAKGLTVIRASFVGATEGGSPYLWDWVVGQEQKAKINGFTNFLWNGVTSKAHARAITGVVKQQNYFRDVQHFVPAAEVSKFELVQLIAKHSKRSDIQISPIDIENPTNLILATTNPSANQRLWLDAGYGQIPTIEQLIVEAVG